MTQKLDAAVCFKYKEAVLWMAFCCQTKIKGRVSEQPRKGSKSVIPRLFQNSLYNVNPTVSVSPPARGGRF